MRNTNHGIGISLLIGLRNRSFNDEEFGIQYLESGIQGVESRIQYCLGFPYLGETFHPRIHVISQQRFGVWFIRSFGFTHQYFDLCSRPVVEAWLEKWAPVMLNFLRDNKAEFRAFTFFLLQGMIGDPGRRGSDGPQGPKVRLWPDFRHNV